MRHPAGDDAASAGEKATGVKDAESMKPEGEEEAPDSTTTEGGGLKRAGVRCGTDCLHVGHAGEMRKQAVY